MIDMTKKKRVVVKVGTSTLTHSTGLLNIRRVEQLVKTLADLQNAGHEIILVSSGAVGLGRAKLGIKERPKDTPTRQACAAVGQCELMYLYDNLFSEYSLNVAQLLLTKYILLEDRRINVQNALNRIIELGSIPIVNENDTVSIDELELEMGENDSLAANVAVLANADLLIIMSDIEGLFDKDPHKYDDAELIPVVPEITEEIKAIAGGAGSSLGTGGMATKIKAAEICKNGGIDLIIMNGRDPRHLYKVFENKPIGTLLQLTGRYSKMSYIDILGQKAKACKKDIAFASTTQKNDALLEIAHILRVCKDDIIEANKVDLENGRMRKMSEAMLDRLALNDSRIEGMAKACEELAQLDDPVGEVVSGSTRPNGMKIEKVRVPMGVIGIIFEARPNVTVDGAILCLKSGNAVILRGGKEAINSNKMLADLMRKAVQRAGFSPDIIQLVEDTDRGIALDMMKANDYIDVLIPRGGAQLIKAVVQSATVPVIETGTGNCHVYVDASADIKWL